MPMCPKCGSPRVDRFCAQCGSAAAREVAARAVQAQSAAPTSGRGKRPRGFFFPLLMVMGIIWVAYYFMAHLVVHAPLMTPEREPEFYGSESLRQLDGEARGRLAGGRAGVDALEARIVGLRSEMKRWSAERDEAVSVRQRLLQSLRQAEFEGRWPTKAAGRYVDRATLQEMIRQVDRWMLEYSATTAAAESKVAKLGIAVGVADKLLLEMQRIEEGLRDPDRSGRAEPGALQADRSRLQQLGVQLELIFGDKSLDTSGLRLGPVDLDRY